MIGGLTRILFGLAPLVAVTLSDASGWQAILLAILSGISVKVGLDHIDKAES